MNHDSIQQAVTSHTSTRAAIITIKLQAAAALLLRSVPTSTTGGDPRAVYRAPQDAFAQPLTCLPWKLTGRAPDQLVATARQEATHDPQAGPGSLELATRAAYVLIASGQLPHPATRPTPPGTRRDTR